MLTFRKIFAVLVFIIALVLTACSAGHEQVDSNSESNTLSVSSATVADSTNSENDHNSFAKEEQSDSNLDSGSNEEHSSLIISKSKFEVKTKTNEFSGELQVHFIDVGQGAAQLVIGPTGKTILIDGGNNDKEELMVAYLKDQGITKLDILIGTHPDADHIGGLDAVINEFDIEQIFMPRIQANTKTFEDVLLAVQNKGLRIATAKAGIELEWESGIDVKMIAPINDYNDTNEMSAVVHLTYGETSFLFTGDAESKSEQDMVSSGVNLKADVLHVGHHGSNSSTSQAFLDKVNPIYAVIQVGKNNYGHPADEVLQRLTAKNVSPFRNDEHGHVIFKSDGKQYHVSQNQWEYNSTTSSKEQFLTSVEVDATKPVESSIPTEVVAGELSVNATIDNPTPRQNSTVTVTVKVNDSQGDPIKDTQVKLELHYKSTNTVYDASTNDSGIATLEFRIGRAAKNFEVKGDITVTHGTSSNTAQVSFIPQ